MSTRALTILVDGHVHLHPCFCPRRFLDGASANFERVASKNNEESDSLGCLLLADMAGQDSFRALRKAERDMLLAPWTLHATEEDAALFARRPGGASILLVAGRQIVSTERIELLALATTHHYEDGRPLEQLLHEVRQGDSLPVLPWSFGKWWFGRGQIMKSLLSKLTEQNDETPEIYFGDNSLRPRCFTTPRLFRQAKSAGLQILPGSDPLPIACHAQNAGRYGFILYGPLNTSYPIRSLKQLLRRQSDQPRYFGAREHLTTFLRDQLTIRVRKQQR